MAKIDPGDIVCLVLCAGEGTRMRPLTYTRPKQLLPLCNVPVIDHILSAVSEAGIREIGMVTGPDPRGLRSHVGDGRRWGLNVAWLVQEMPKGIGDAVLVAESYVDERPFIVYLGDALYEGGIAGFVQQFARIFPASLVRLTPVDEPQHYGVAVVEDQFIRAVEEKAKMPPTNLAITGLYAFPPGFFDAIRRTPPSDRGELEITDAIAEFLCNPAGVQAEVWRGGWADAGQHHTFLEASRQVLDWAEDMENAGVVEDSVLNGKVGAGEGTTITGSRLDGPVLLGEGCRVVNSCIGPYVSAGDRTVIENSNVRDTVIDADVVVADLKRGLEGSIVGVRSKLIGNGRGGSPVRQLVADDTELRLE